jgi:hypothetical protein
MWVESAGRSAKGKMLQGFTCLAGHALQVDSFFLCIFSLSVCSLFPFLSLSLFSILSFPHILSLFSLLSLSRTYLFFSLFSLLSLSGSYPFYLSLSLFTHAKVRIYSLFYYNNDLSIILFLSKLSQSFAFLLRLDKTRI